MAIDTPARIAIIGAGPIGLEAGLYARYLGYEVDIFEQGEAVAAHVACWGHVTLFTPFGMNCSPLAIAAIQAQDEEDVLPEASQFLTGKQWRERYLIPLAKTDLLQDSIHTNTAVVAVGKESLRKSELPGDESRGDEAFRILTRDNQGDERVYSADVVIDGSGVFSQPHRIGRGGIPAIGETDLANRIEYHLPDVTGTQRDKYVDRHTLVVGSGYSAATTVVKLLELSFDHPSTTVTWITDGQATGGQPIRPVEGDPLSRRDALVKQANKAVAKANVHWRPGAMIDSLAAHEDGFAVRIATRSEEGEEEPRETQETITVDQIVANVGYRGDDQLFRELQVHQCYATGGPMKLAATLLENPSDDCLQQQVEDREVLRNPEPNFYVLGAKSYGRNSQFLYAHGLEQIVQLFSIVGDRENLNLYATMKNLIQ